MEHLKWVDRTFITGLHPGLLHEILERLRGTPVRIRHMVSSLGGDETTFRLNGKWSINENTGHLIDLEVLHDGRIDDFLQRKPELRPADMSNAATDAANHNSKPLRQLIDELETVRNKLIVRLENLDDKTQLFNSMHPRLKMMMRPVDMAFFIAEHDDHHLARIREIMRELKQSSEK